MMLSVIVPVYNEEGNLEQFHNELYQVLNSLNKDYEVIYVDDGSNDNSLKIINNIIERCERTKAIQFSKHYGQTEAIQAGIDFSKGEVIIFIDADMQNDPGDIPRLISKIGEGYDIVSGWRRKRKDRFFTRRITSYLANLLISYFSKIRLHDYGCTLKAYRKEAIKGIRLFSEMHRLIPIYAVRQNRASIIEIEVSHRKRLWGNSKYGLSRVYKVVLDFLISEFINNYFNKPMYFFGILSVYLFLFSVISGIGVIVRKVLFGGVWVSPLLFLPMLSMIISVQFFLMGLLAEIAIRSYYKIGGETTYSIKRIIEKNILTTKPNI